MKDNLKIAQLVPYYSPVIGGVEAVCQYISEEIASRGHEVHVFTANRNHKGSPPLYMNSYEVINSVHVHRFPSYISVGHHGYFPGFIKPLKTGQFDIIHSHGYRQPQSEIGARIGAALHVPTILHIHGGFYATSRIKQFFYNQYDSWARRHRANNFDHFVVLSEGDREQLHRLNVDANKVSIIRNAAENQAFEPVDSSALRKRFGLEGKKVILYLSILHQYKRPELLVQALPQLIEQVPDVFVLFAGPDAGELEKINQIGEKLGVSGYFKWVGPLRGSEKHEAFDCAHFLALPADEDPYPLVLLEAMAHGKPLLTTSVVGQASVIKKYNTGVIVRPGDVDSIATAAVRLLTDCSYHAAIASNARSLAENMFSARGVVNEIEGLYRRMIEAKDAYGKRYSYRHNH